MRLQEMRKKEFPSQEEAAEFFGFTRRTYQNYETGKTSPTMEDAAMMARHFHCTIGELFDLEEGHTPDLRPDEMTLLADYRSLSDEDKAIASRIVCALKLSE